MGRRRESVIIEGRGYQNLGDDSGLAEGFEEEGQAAGDYHRQDHLPEQDRNGERVQGLLIPDTAAGYTVQLVAVEDGLRRIALIGHLLKEREDKKLSSSSQRIDAWGWKRPMAS